MKNPLLLSILLTLSYSTGYSDENPPTPELAQVGIGVEVEAGNNDYYEDNQYIWIGPGLYYGIWFDNEWEYDDWYHYHYHGRHHDHHDHHDHHHEGHHGGGGHHHGGGGGHHH